MRVASEMFFFMLLKSWLSLTELNATAL